MADALAPILFVTTGDRVGLLALALPARGQGAVSSAIPFLLKALVDGLESSQSQSPIGASLVTGCWCLAYGGARLANTLFAELRDTLFGRVTERAMRSHWLASVFRHVHSSGPRLSPQSPQTGGLARDIERGSSAHQLSDALFSFSISPPRCLEISIVAGILVVISYGAQYAAVVDRYRCSVYARLFLSRDSPGAPSFVRDVNDG